MAYYNDNYIKPAKAYGTHHTPMDVGLEAASCTNRIGTPLVYSSGYLTGATAGAVTNVVGVSLDTGHNDSSAGTSNMPYIPATPSQVFVAALNTTSAIGTHMGSSYGLGYDSSSTTWYVDTSESSSSQKCVTVVGFKDANGTANGLVYFVFNRIGRLVE